MRPEQQEKYITELQHCPCMFNCVVLCCMWIQKQI